MYVCTCVCVWELSPRYYTVARNIRVRTPLKQDAHMLMHTLHALTCT